MTVHCTPFSAELLAYLRQISATEHPILAQIRADTATHRLGKMAIAPEQAALLAWIAQLIDAKKYLENWHIHGVQQHRNGVGVAR